MKMSVKYWWNDTDKVKQKYWEKSLSHCDIVQHKSNMDCPGMEPLPLRVRPATNRLSLRQASVIFEG